MLTMSYKTLLPFLFLLPAVSQPTDELIGQVHALQVPVVTRSSLASNSSTLPFELTPKMSSIVLEDRLATLVKAAWTLTGVVLFVYVVGGVFYRLYLSPLAKFPGPKLAAATLWYEFYYDNILKGQYTFKIMDLHKKYGWLYSRSGIGLQLIIH